MTSALPWIGAALFASLFTGRWMLPFDRSKEELGMGPIHSRRRPGIVLRRRLAWVATVGFANL